MRCNSCPRLCDVDRSMTRGFCGAGEHLRIARAALHFYEEPCICGTHGSGAIFFSGCNLRCIFCQNLSLQSGSAGHDVSACELSEIMLRLQSEGAHNINLVTPTPHTLALRDALRLAKSSGLVIPVVYNTSAYERVETIEAFSGLVDIWLPDLKYHESMLSAKFSAASDYFEYAIKAIDKMYELSGRLTMNDDGIASSGVLIRHLVLPCCLYDTRAILDEIAAHFGRDCHISLMRQYTPLPCLNTPPLNRRITDREYNNAVNHALMLGMEKVYIQDKSSASMEFTPEFEN